MEHHSRGDCRLRECEEFKWFHFCCVGSFHIPLRIPRNFSPAIFVAQSLRVLLP